MAPSCETLVTPYPSSRTSDFSRPKPPRISTDGLQRAFSDLSFQLSKEPCLESPVPTPAAQAPLPPISEVENAQCECCGMCEECTPEYICRVRDRFSGKWICGLCAEAVKEEAAKGEGMAEEAALAAHMSACSRFNRIGRAYPLLYRADAMREILKKSSSMAAMTDRGRGLRSNSNSPRDRATSKKGSAITRSSSCIAAITKDIIHKD